jgi:uncharacterized protein YraI
MSRRHWALVVALILINYIVFASLFNVVFGSRPSAVAPTRTPLPTFTPAPTPTPAPPVPTMTPVPLPPTATPTLVMATPAAPAPAPAATPVAAANTPASTGPVVTVNTSLNVRTGPGVVYDRVGSLASGATADILGRNADSGWWQISYDGAPEGKGWISASYGEARNTDGVPVVEAPPAPTPKPATATPPPPAATAKPPSSSGINMSIQFQPKGSYAGTNAGLTRFMGHITDRSGNPVNGFFLYFTCGSFHVMSFPSGPSSVAPDWAPGWYDQYVASKELDCDWTMQVVMYKCGSWFNSECTTFDALAPPDYFHTYKGHTVVTADWWCNFDCDKGMQR